VTTQPITVVPHAKAATITYDLPNGAPNVQNIAPTRITIRYSQHESFPIPHVIEVDIKGQIRDADGQPGPFSRTINYRKGEQLPAWAAELVHDNLPAWWTE
jgi:hypothetical protein